MSARRWRSTVARGKRKPMPELVARDDCAKCEGAAIIQHTTKLHLPGGTESIVLWTLCKCVRESDGGQS